MTGLLAIATELLRDICERTSGDDIRNIRAVCKRLNIIVAPKFFSRLTVNIHKDHLDEAKHLLSTLSAGESPFSSFAQTLEILSVAPASDPRGYSNCDLVMDRQEDDDPDFGHVVLHMKQHLGQAICSLKNISTVSWNVGQCDPEWAVDTVVTSISSIPCLKSFSIKFIGFPAPLPAIGKLKGLQKLAIFGYNDRHGVFQRYVTDQVHLIICNSPGLTHLDLVSHHGCIDPSLRDIFGETGSPSLKLQYLRLYSWLMPLDAVTIPHLRSLTSLELFHYPYSGDVEQLWRNLLAEDIQLTELITGDISDELLRYLASYSGLKTLQLRSLSPDSTNLADRLFHDALPRHKDTLETLHLRTWFEGLWCFGQGNADLILKCQKLVVLLMSVEYNLWNKDKSDTSDPLLFILEKIAHLPRLQELTLLPAQPLSNRYNTCGTAGMNYEYQVGKIMQATILHFIPDPTVHPEVVQLGGETFNIDLWEGASETHWRYLPSVYQASALKTYHD